MYMYCHDIFVAFVKLECRGDLFFMVINSYFTLELCFDSGSVQSSFFMLIWGNVCFPYDFQRFLQEVVHIVLFVLQNMLNYVSLGGSLVFFNFNFNFLNYSIVNIQYYIVYQAYNIVVQLLYDSLAFV